MNLYGEYGNVSALERYLRMQDAEVTIDRLTVGDAPDFGSYDLVYIGIGHSPVNLNHSLRDLMIRDSSFFINRHQTA